MKPGIIVATLLATTAFGTVTAQALTINLGADLGVGVVISSDDLDVNVGAGVDANANTNTNTNGGNNNGGNTNTNVNAGVDAGAAVTTNGNGNGNANAGAAVAAEGGIRLRGEGDEDLMLDVDAVLNLAVWTEDGVQIGTVSDVDLDAEGNGMLFVDLDDNWIEGMTRVAIRASAVVHTSEGLRLGDDETDLRAAIMAAVAANATTTTNGAAR